MESSLEDALASCKSLPSMPAVAARILELARTDCGLKDVVPVIRSDPALAAKIIRQANTAAYYRSEPTSSLNQAVLKIGLDATMTVALSFTLLDSLRPSTEGSLDYERYWRRALVSAAAAKFIAQSFGVPRIEDAFLAGLLQDIGMMALDAADIGIYDAPDWQQSEHRFICAVETGRLRTTHAEVGAWLLERWRFPDAIVKAVATSHDLAHLTAAEPSPTLPWCVAYSGELSDAILEDDPGMVAVALAWADAYEPNSEHGWQQAALEHLSTAIWDVEWLFIDGLAPNITSLMAASKELMAERALKQAGLAP